MKAAADTDVLIIGAGPSGLLAAIELARHGVQARVIEREQAAPHRRIPRHLVELSGVSWAAVFRMHKRLTPHLADGRRFLLGDAGHLSSPFGGEGLNSGLHDAHNLAWKLALELHGRGRPGLTDTFADERGAAARHVLAVSDQLHELVQAAVESARTGRSPAPTASPSPAHTRGAGARPRHARRLLRSQPADEQLPAGWRSGTAAQVRRPRSRSGGRYPQRFALRGTGHHLLVSGRPGRPALDHLRSRWAGLLDVHAFEGNGAVLVRPDGYLGFRAASADAAGLAALDANLVSYLIPS